MRRLAFAALALVGALDAHAYGSGQFNTYLTGCNTCHGGGATASPSPAFVALERAAKVGARFEITAGVPATLALDVKTPTKKGLGLAVSVEDGITIAAVRDDTRVDRQILGHAHVLFEPSGRYRVPFVLTAAASTCGRSFTLRASVVAANRNGAPTGDSVALTRVAVSVNCAPGAQPPPADKP